MYLFLIEEMHAEICYAECLLQKAALTFVQVITVWLNTGVGQEACQRCTEHGKCCSACVSTEA
jgi:hypothetical protein